MGLGYTCRRSVKAVAQIVEYERFTTTSKSDDESISKLALPSYPVFLPSQMCPLLIFSLSSELLLNLYKLISLNHVFETFLREFTS